MQLFGDRKVVVTKSEVARFNSKWPGSTLRETRSYWFDFASNGDLVDTDIPEQDDGDAASAMSDDCKRWLFDQIEPEWVD